MEELVYHLMIAVAALDGQDPIVQHVGVRHTTIFWM